MARNRVDKGLCRVCKLGVASGVDILAVKGRQRGICRACRNSYERGRAAVKRSYGSLYQQRPGLVARNLQVLATLRTGFYRLKFTPTKVCNAGYIGITDDGAVFVDAWNQQNLFMIDLWGISTFLGNQNLAVTTEPVSLNDSNGKPITLEQIREQYPLTDVAKKLIWLDRSLFDRAVAVVEAEFKDDLEGLIALAQVVANQRELCPDEKRRKKAQV